MVSKLCERLLDDLKEEKEILAKLQNMKHKTAIIRRDIAESKKIMASIERDLEKYGCVN